MLTLTEADVVFLPAWSTGQTAHWHSSLQDPPPVSEGLRSVRHYHCIRDYFLRTG